LRFHTRGSFAPTRIEQRHNGMTGFVFELPPEFQRIAWAEFLEDFQGVFAECDTPEGTERWMVRLFKSVMAAFDPSNKTAIQAEVLTQYKMEPKPNGRVAVLTTVYNEPLMLPLWAKYYGQEFGPENLFVLDHESMMENELPISGKVNILRLPRDVGDSFLNVRMMSFYQRLLLEVYDTVIYVDSDEFLCVDPAVAAGRSLREFLLELAEPIGIATGYNLHHIISSEPPYNPLLPLLLQRRVIVRTTSMDKPAVSRVPLNWIPGFHYCREGGSRVDGLYLLHLRWFDLNQAQHKGSKYRASKWSKRELEKELASYNRAGADEITAQFQSWARRAQGLGDVTFDPEADMTVIPDWMREAIWF
jgi:hypothetical protein